MWRTVEEVLSRPREWRRITCVSVICVFGTLAFPLHASAQSGAASQTARQASPRSPGLTARPERIVLTWCGDPSSSQAVTWRTSVDIPRACAEIAPAKEGPRFFQNNQGREFKRIRFVNGLRRVEAQTSLFKLNELQCHVHAVRFDNLTPETRYVYRVGDGVHWSEWFQFRTASREAKPFCFLYFGDTQDELASMCSWVIREAFSAAPRAAFTLHGGDLTSAREDDSAWGEWFTMMGWVNAMVPAIVTPGNHDYVKSSSDGKTPAHLEPHWRAQFTLPENGPPGLEETAYYIDYQGARIISLNSNDRLEEQARWLERILSDNENTWTVIVFHHPMFAVANDRTSATRQAWKAVFDRHRVDLVLTGHDHAYARSRLIGPDDGAASSRGAKGGTVYVVSVSGPKMNRLGPARGEPPLAEFTERVAEDLQLYQIITIDGPTLRYESRTATGSLYDAFTLTRQTDGTNELSDQAPDTPEHRRVGPDADYAVFSK